MADVALVVHNDRSSAANLARETARWLAEAGHSARLLHTDAAVVGLPELGVEAEALTEGCDLAVSLGGDGTMLRTVDLVAAAEIPVIGVNLGQLGYLTEVDPARLRDSLAQYFAGGFEIEERMLLEVRVDAPSGGVDADVAVALNEAVIEKTESGHTVRLDVTINDHFFTPYATDGVIVATPTGSTAYAFSARGPIVAPTHRALLLTPVSPHMLFDRTLVLEPTTELRITVAGHRPAALSVDGRMLGQLHLGDSIVATAAPHRARLVIFSPRDFHQILKSKFGLSDR
jgi:NAD+ kinase